MQRRKFEKEFPKNCFEREIKYFAISIYDQSGHWGHRGAILATSTLRPVACLIFNYSPSPTHNTYAPLNLSLSLPTRRRPVGRNIENRYCRLKNCTKKKMKPEKSLRWGINKNGKRRHDGPDLCQQMAALRTKSV